jgi:hypothetical protein
MKAILEQLRAVAWVVIGISTFSGGFKWLKYKDGHCAETP